jgi:glycosyltransferase involved in cell wall biosynthesis
MTADTAGGVWPHALTLAGALSRRGVRTSLAVFTEGLAPSMRAEAWSVPGLQIFEGAFGLEWMEDPWEDVRQAGEWLLSLARVLRPDVVHLNSHVLGGLGWPVPVVVETHGSVCAWWEAVHGVPAPAAWERYRAEVRRGLLGAARVVAPSKAMLDDLSRHHGPVPGARVVYLARTLNAVRGLEKEPWVLTAGRPADPATNVVVLEAAAASIPIRVAGPGQASGAGRPRAGLELVGPLGPEAMRVAMARAAIYAHPAAYEASGLLPLEAALQGCALVLSDIPTLRELWEGAAVFVPPRDAEAWRTALRMLLDEVPRRRRRAVAARARAGTFRPERLAEEMLRVYEGARSETRGASPP